MYRAEASYILGDRERQRDRERETERQRESLCVKLMVLMLRDCIMLLTLRHSS